MDCTIDKGSRSECSESSNDNSGSTDTDSSEDDGTLDALDQEGEEEGGTAAVRDMYRKLGFATRETPTAALVHARACQVHVGHVPEDGPSQVPAWHVRVAGHQPHPREFAQLLQSRLTAQLVDAEGGGAEHWELLHVHCEQLLPAGPSQVPARQRLLLWQKPQPVAFVHDPHAVWEPQLPQVLDAPNCHDGHCAPLEGPDAVPDRHELVEGHQPQPLVAAQAAHDVALLQLPVLLGGGVLVPPPLLLLPPPPPLPPWAGGAVPVHCE